MPGGIPSKPIMPSALPACPSLAETKDDVRSSVLLDLQPVVSRISAIHSAVSCRTLASEAHRT